MALRKGYRLTEVGVIPSDWECKKLGEIADVVRGGSPRPAGDPKYFNGDFIPWLTVASLTNIPESIQEVTSTSTMLTKLGSLHSRILEKDTLIISNSGATLGVAKILGIKCCANDGVAALINQKSGCKSFLAHYINTKTKELHDKIATGNGQPNLNTDLIKNISVPFPPEDEQVAIAKTLNDVDALITQLQRLINKKHQIKLGAMQTLLNPFDRNGKLKDGWEEKTLADICSIEKGQMITSGSVCFGEIPVIAGGRKPAYFHNQPNRKGTTITISASGASAGYVNIFHIPIFASDCSTISESDDYCIDFIYYSLLARQEEIYRSQTGGAQPHIHARDIYPIAIGIPCFNEQCVIADILKDMDTEILLLKQKLIKVRQLKQGMMQSLLTGEIRLVTPNQN